jgi:hypothetical protein
MQRNSNDYCLSADFSLLPVLSAISSLYGYAINTLIEAHAGRDNILAVSSNNSAQFKGRRIDQRDRDSGCW